LMRLVRRGLMSRGRNPYFSVILVFRAR